MDEKLIYEAVKRAFREIFLEFKESFILPRWLSTKDAVRYSGLSEKTLRKLAREGEIYAASVGGGKLLFDRESIDNYLLKQQREVKVRAQALVKEILSR